MNNVDYIDPDIVNHINDKQKRRLAKFLRESHMEQCRQDFAAYIAYVDPVYEFTPFHRTIIGVMQDVADEKESRVMVNCPPRHGKSRIISELFPAWFLGRHPKKHVVACSHGDSLAKDFGRKARRIVESPEHQDVFPNSILAQDSKAANNWGTNEGGSYYATSTGGSVTGRGADIVLLDDLVKGHEEADSETQRESIHKWYKSDLRTRLLKGGRIVGLMTRWHEDDIAGRLLAQNQESTGSKWKHIHFKAIDDDGNALWPSEFPISSLRETKVDVGPRVFRTLYQNEPVRDDGTFFKREWIKRFDIGPDNLRIFGASDYAVSEGKGDYTVHSVVGVDEHDRIFLLDVWRKRTTPKHWIEALLAMMRKWQPQVWLEEGGVIRKSVGELITKRMKEERIYILRVPFNPTSDKTSRARSIQGRIEMGMVYFPNVEWFDDLLSEMMAFPLGKHDDFVDTLSLFGNHLPGLMKASKKPGPKPDVDWDNLDVVTYDQAVQHQRLVELERGKNPWGV